MFTFCSRTSYHFHFHIFKSHSFNGPLIRVKNIAVRERGSKVVLDLGVAYNGDAFLGVSLMKVASHETEIRESFL